MAVSAYLAVLFDTRCCNYRVTKFGPLCAACPLPSLTAISGFSTSKELQVPGLTSVSGPLLVVTD